MKLERRGPRVFIGLVSAAAAIAIGLAPLATPAASKTLRFEGFLVSSRNDVELTVQMPRRGHPRGTLTIHDLPLACEDESLIFISPPPIKLRFTGPRQFSADRYSPLDSPGGERYFGVNGWIAPDLKRAYGYAFAYQNRDDAASGEAPECSTRLEAAWRLKRRG